MFFLLSAFAALSSQTDTTPVTEPSLEEFSAWAEPAIRAKLVEPETATIEWPYGFEQGEDGPATCGRVNAKNRIGGYPGHAYVLITYKPGSTPEFVMDDVMEPGDVAARCKESILQGRLKPR